MRERRKHPRYDATIGVNVKTVTPGSWTPAFRGTTVDVCAEGVAVALYGGENSRKLIPSLLAKHDAVELALELPPDAQTIGGKGTIRWLDIGSIASSRPYVRAGIFLERMTARDKARWKRFVKETAGKNGDAVSRAGM
jgi:hypothetical protein